MGRLVGFLNRIEAVLLVCAFLLMLVTAVVQITARNLSGTGFFWGDALVRTLVLWVAMLGGMSASRSGRHIHVDLVDHYMRGRAGLHLKRVSQLITALVCAAVSYASWIFAAGEYDANTKAIGQIPVWIFAAILPLGFGVMGIRHFLIALSAKRLNAIREASI